MLFDILYFPKMAAACTSSMIYDRMSPTIVYDVHVDQTTMLYFEILTLKMSLICSKILILAFFNRF